MVRIYKRITDRQKWDVQSMESAVESVISGEMGYLKASQQFDVPKTTLERYVTKKKNNCSYEIDKTEGKYKKVFTQEQETELAEYLKSMESRLFGLTVKDLQLLAFQLAERNGLSHRFNNTTGMAGQDWAKGFLSRHPTLSIRKPEATSGARAMGFNQVAVSQFFTLLTQNVDKYKLTCENIYNCDETGISVNPKNHSKIIALKGKRQVGDLTSSERGETVTAALCMSAAGSFMPPMVIFPRKKKQQGFEIGLPPGAWSEVHETGWMTAELFLLWFGRFVDFSQASKQSPVLLIFDGHSTHTKNIKLIDMARDNGVILLCLPPHTSHRLQPLDVAFMKPLSLHYGEELRKWLRSNPGKVVTLWQVSSIFGAAFVQSANMKTAINGFKATGIWPPDPNVFSEEDFLPAATTEITLNEKECPSTRTGLHVTETAQSIPVGNDPPTKKAKLNEDAAQPGCSSWMPDSPVIAQTKPISSAFQSASPEIVMPLPAVKQNVKRSNRKKGKTAVLTESPYKRELENALNEKKEKQKAKEERKIILKNKQKAKEDDARIKLFHTRTRKKRAKKTSSKSKVFKETMQEDCEMKTKQSLNSSVLVEDDADCLYCGERYSTSNEGWVSCHVCKKWAHNSCAGMDSEDDEALICEYCK